MKSRLKEKVLSFLQKNESACLATIGLKGGPQVATIYFTVDNDLNLYFAVTPNSRKYASIKRDNRVAVAITNIDKEQTLQMEGVAEELDGVKKNTKAFPALMKLFDKYVWDKVPVVRIEKGEVAYFKVTPKWMRWADFKDPANSDAGEFFEQLIP